jgi:cystathionine beta-lyase/cystathionine gamma-synthase
VIGANQLYGRSLRLMNQDLARFGIGTSLADPTDIDAMRAAIRPETRMILVEVVSNPTLRVADMAGIAALAREAGVLLAVDNTFTTPRAWRPFEHGADIVIHSITKLLAGHSDVTLGYVAARNPGLQRAIYDFAVTWAFTPSPYECWLAERGMYTFPLRYDRAEANAMALGRPPRFPPEGGARALSRAGRSPRCGPGGGASGGADRQHGELRDRRATGRRRTGWSRPRRNCPSRRRLAMWARR